MHTDVSKAVTNCVLNTTTKHVSRPLAAPNIVLATGTDDVSENGDLIGMPKTSLCKTTPVKEG